MACGARWGLKPHPYGVMTIISRVAKWPVEPVGD